MVRILLPPLPALPQSNHCIHHRGEPKSIAPQVPEEYQEFMVIFSKNTVSGLPPHKSYDCAVDLLLDTNPPCSCIYPLSLAAQQAMEEYVQELLQQDAGGLHPCIDHQGLNQITIKYPYPLPLVPSALKQLNITRIFMKLDLRGAYSLVCLRPGDQWKTAFHTTSGQYEYTVMSYGLFCIPSVFQCLTNGVLRDMLGRFIIANIDDFLIYSPS